MPIHIHYFFILLFSSLSRSFISQILFDVSCTNVPFLYSVQMPVPSEVSSLEMEVAQLKQEVKKLEMEREELSTELKEYQKIRKESIVSGLYNVTEDRSFKNSSIYTVCTQCIIYTYITCM